MVVVDANLLAHMASKGAEMLKHVQFIATCLSDNGVRSLIRTHNITLLKMREHLLIKDLHLLLAFGYLLVMLVGHRVNYSMKLIGIHGM